MPEGGTTDITRGIYRRVYAGFLVGRRINSVSLEAEAWFWRLHAVADDFGNLHGDALLLRSIAAPRREVTEEQVMDWNGQLVNAGLITAYEADGEAFFSIIRFTDLQPANKNGRRIMRVPGESGGIRGNPEAPSPNQSPGTGTGSHSVRNPGAGVSKKPSRWPGWSLLTADAMTDTAKLLAWYGRFVADVGVADTTENRLAFVALAEESTRKGTKPPAMLVSKLKRWNMSCAQITQMDDKAATVRLKAWDDR